MIRGCAQPQAAEKRGIGVLQLGSAQNDTCQRTQARPVFRRLLYQFSLVGKMPAFPLQAATKRVWLNSTSESSPNVELGRSGSGFLPRRRRIKCRGRCSYLATAKSVLRGRQRIGRTTRVLMELLLTPRSPLARYRIRQEWDG